MTNDRIGIGWPVFVWPAITFGSMLVFGLGLGAVLSIQTPDHPWDRATAIGVCGRFAILRQEDGSVWLRVNSVRAYRIEGDWKMLCK
jgi:hypothetical protein